MNDLVVAWRELLPLEDLIWAASFNSTVADLQPTTRIRLNNSSDKHVDVLVTAYLATDHEEVEDNGVLQTLLAQQTISISTLFVVACSQSRPALHKKRVRRLLIDQGRSYPFDHQHSARAALPDNLGQELFDLFSVSIRRSNLSLPTTHAENFSPDASSLDTVGRITLEDL